MDPLTEDRKQEIWTRVRAATCRLKVQPNPATPGTAYVTVPGPQTEKEHTSPDLVAVYSGPNARNDAQLHAAAHEDIPLLLRRIESLEAEAAQLLAALILAAKDLTIVQAALADPVDVQGARTHVQAALDIIKGVLGEPTWPRTPEDPRPGVLSQSPDRNVHGAHRLAGAAEVPTRYVRPDQGAFFLAANAPATDGRPPGKKGG